MKKLLYLITILFFSFTSVFAASDVTLHTKPSVRQQGIGGFYTTDGGSLYEIFANPALMAEDEAHTLLPSLNVDIGGPLASLLNLVKNISSIDADTLLPIIQENNGLSLYLGIAPCLSFGHVSEGGFGWAFNTNLFIDALVPSLTKSDIGLGGESVLTMGYGFNVLDTENHDIDVGFTGKGFLQLKAAYNGQPMQIMDFFNDVSSIPMTVSTGFGFDVGAVYRYKENLSVGLVWYDVLAPVFTTKTTVSNATGSASSLKYDGMMNSKLAVGVDYSIPVDWSAGFISSIDLRCDYRNIFALFNPVGRNPILELSCGADMVLFRMLSVRVGLSDMYPAVGMGISLGSFKIDFSLYGKEQGLEPGSSPLLNAGLFLGFSY